MDGLFRVLEAEGLGAPPRQPLACPRAALLSRRGDRGQCPAVRGPHAVRLALQITKEVKAEVQALRWPGDRDLVNAGPRHAA